MWPNKKDNERYKKAVALEEEALLKVLTEERVKTLFVAVCPHFEHTAFKITHIGPFDENGERHIGAKAVIVSDVGRIVIWEDDIKYYKGMHASVINGAFTAFRLLDNWKFFDL
jgi:hypothetical protein